MKPCLIVMCIGVVFSLGEECSKKESDDEIYIESRTACSISFQLKFPGYQMEAEIQELKLDTSVGDYLSFKPEHDEKEYKFAWTQKNPKKFIIDQSKVTITFHSTSPRNRFKIHLKRHGELTTTTEPTTIITWPTPIANDSIYHTVNVAISTKEFTKQELLFKEVLANMTNEYCKKNNIALRETATEKNINFKLVIQCPTEWPNYSNCIQIQYAIPVFLAESERYELTSIHLKQMWEKMAKKNLQDSLSWDLYEIPDDSYSLLIWLIISLVILAAFFGFLFFARIFSIKCGNGMKRRTSDAEQIITTPKRVSDASLWPISTQSIPPLFENESSYIYFEPDTTMRHHQQQIPNNPIMNVDDSSDEEVLTVNSNSIRTKYKQNVINLDLENNKESAL